ncbi:MAG: M48 family metallopeptidase, partial [Synergistaceae bacterium]|nr:M48 family metallopeptidase [Synergistaceae bacterium]
VVIQLGLLKVLKTEDEIAGVLGHEIGHGVKRHGEKRQGNTIGIMIGANMLSTIFGGGALGDLAVGIGANLATSGYSRENEVEADDYGVEYSTKAGFDPWGLYNSINSMAKAGLVTPPSGFNSHPPTERRMTRLKSEAEKWEKYAAKSKHAAKTEAKQAETKQTGLLNVPENSPANKSDKADVITSYPISAGEKNVLTILHNRATSLYNAGKHKDALAAFTKGADSYKWNYLAALWAARNAQKLGNTKDMQKWIEKSLEINPNYVPAKEFRDKYIKK